MQLVVAIHSVIVYLQNEQLLYNQRIRDTAYDSHVTWIGFCFLLFLIVSNTLHPHKHMNVTTLSNNKKNKKKNPPSVFTLSHQPLFASSTHRGWVFLLAFGEQISATKCLDQLSGLARKGARAQVVWSTALETERVKTRALRKMSRHPLPAAWRRHGTQRIKTTTSYFV